LKTRKTQENIIKTKIKTSQHPLENKNTQEQNLSVFLFVVDLLFPLPLLQLFFSQQIKFTNSFFLYFFFRVANLTKIGTDALIFLTEKPLLKK